MRQASFSVEVGNANSKPSSGELQIHKQRNLGGFSVHFSLPSLARTYLRDPFALVPAEGSKSQRLRLRGLTCHDFDLAWFRLAKHRVFNVLWLIPTYTITECKLGIQLGRGTHKLSICLRVTILVIDYSSHAHIVPLTLKVKEVYNKIFIKKS